MHYLIYLLIIIVDQYTKYLAYNFDEPIILINKLIALTFHKNHGSALSMFPVSTNIITIFSVITMISLLLYLPKITKDYQKKYISIFMAGAIGNLIDRIFRGYVIDFIGLNIYNGHGIIFNIADLAIFIGLVGLIFTSVKFRNKHQNSY